MTALQQIKTIDKVRSNFILYRGKNKGPDYSKEGKELILKKLKKGTRTHYLLMKEEVD